MARRFLRLAVPLLCLAALAACAAPRATPPAAAPAAAPPAAPAPGAAQPAPAAEETDPLGALRDDPAMVAATAAIDAAAPAERPAALMRRAREAFATALEIRSARGGPYGFSWVVGHEEFLAYTDLALGDLREVIEAHPAAPEAAEALFTVGRINDYPYLNLFDEAIAAYRLTIERHPGSGWAQKARERIALIEGITLGVSGRPPAPATTPAPPPAPSR